ncbi:MAG: helix-turn-helix domain-containing protein, partial [Oscillatoria sp. PMC 1068.18]|nr:helix-turn-helix domain-containing protein [Oscillatoria sp. PMC 1068.18]
TQEEINELLLGLLKPQELASLDFVSLKIGQEEVSLPLQLYELLIQATKIMKHGKAVSLMPIDSELTIEEAASLLNVSKSFLVKLLEEEAIFYSNTGVKKRIHLSDLIAYKKQRDTKRRELMIELAQFSQEEELNGKNINS